MTKLRRSKDPLSNPLHTTYLPTKTFLSCGVEYLYILLYYMVILIKISLPSIPRGAKISLWEKKITNSLNYLERY